MIQGLSKTSLEKINANLPIKTNPSHNMINECFLPCSDVGSSASIHTNKGKMTGAKKILK